MAKRVKEKVTVAHLMNALYHIESWVRAVRAALSSLDPDIEMRQFMPLTNGVVPRMLTNCPTPIGIRLMENCPNPIDSEDDETCSDDDAGDDKGKKGKKEKKDKKEKKKSSRRRG